MFDVTFLDKNKEKQLCW